MTFSFSSSSGGGGTPSGGTTGGYLDPTIKKGQGTVRSLDPKTGLMQTYYFNADDPNSVPTAANGQQYNPSAGASGDSSAGSSGKSGGSGSSGSSGSDTFTSAAKSATDLAKDMAQFQLGINAQQGEQDYGLRKKEGDDTLGRTMNLNQQGFNFDTAKAAQQYGYTSALEGQAFGENTQLKQQDYQNTSALQGQQNTANLGLDAQRNAAQMSQLTKQTDTQKEMQSADFNNQSTQRAQAAALAQLGFRR